MWILRLRPLALVGVILLVLAHSQAPGPLAQASGVPLNRVDCASLPGVQLAGARITEAAAFPAGESGPVKVRALPRRRRDRQGDSLRRILPDRWNERLFAGGGGGFVGSPRTRPLPARIWATPPWAPTLGMTGTAPTRDGRSATASGRSTTAILASIGPPRSPGLS